MAPKLNREILHRYFSSLFPFNFDIEVRVYALQALHSILNYTDWCCARWARSAMCKYCVLYMRYVELDASVDFKRSPVESLTFHKNSNSKNVSYQALLWHPQTQRQNHSGAYVWAVDSASGMFVELKWSDTGDNEDSGSFRCHFSHWDLAEFSTKALPTAWAYSFGI